VDYAWNRYYSPTWGRFMQADPSLTPEALKNPQAWNRYAYVAGDPVNYYDPAGLDACSGNYGAPCFSITVVRFLYFRNCLPPPGALSSPIGGGLSPEFLNPPRPARAPVGGYGVAVRAG